MIVPHGLTGPSMYLPMGAAGNAVSIGGPSPAPAMRAGPLP
jgi:hypothetical protein